MVSADSPVLHFYPVDFGIDQDGKKNPWEAVVLLDFIDEKLLMEAERLHCPVDKLSRAEHARNQFGTVLTHLFDPGCVEAYPSCNPEIGLPDIPSCQSSVTDSYPSLAPGKFFLPELIPGTVYPIAGFPSLTILPLNGMKTEAVKVNMFGAESKYKSVILEIKSPEIQSLDSLNAELLLGRIVYVNYPQIHEAKVVAVSTVKEEVRIVNGLPQRTKWDHAGVRQWEQESEEEEEKYLKGRGTPGTGGLRIGKVVVRLRVAPLQGLHRDPNTGACRKVFSAKEEADIPIQMALWTPPVVDTRFEESAELSLEELMPHGAEVVALTGDLQGYKGKIVGPHGADAVGAATASKRSSLKEDIKKDQQEVAGATKPKRRVVDVEFTVTPPEPPFGYSIANSVKEEYYSSKDLCALLQISASVLGKIVGMIRVEPGRADLGLNLKRNGQYQLLGYSQRVDYNNAGGDPAAAHFQSRQVWGGVDTVEIIGMVASDGGAAEKAAEADGATWQYTARAAALIFDYKANFPMLFQQLERLPHQPVYSADALLGPGGDKKLEQVAEWMKSQPFFKLPRTPFTTTSLSKDAMAAVERAADVQTSKRKTSGDQAVVKVKGIPVENLFCAVHRGVGDVALAYNQLEPKLGDRVVNLTCPGVPFGFRGTVVTIHAATKFVELIFDEEFIGGKGLQGSCSQFRGRLAPWSDLLLVSRSTEYLEFKKGKAVGKAAPAKAAGMAGIVPQQQVKHVLQKGAAGGPALAPAPPLPKPSFAKAVTGAASAPVALTHVHASAGQKLLKALQKEDKVAAPKSAPPAAAPTTASKVAILKRKIGVVESTAVPAGPAEPAPAAAGDLPVPPPVVPSKKGVSILAEAAGFSAADLASELGLLPSAESMQHHAAMAGVISYQAQQASALHKSSLTTAPAMPPPAHASSHERSASSPSRMLRKDTQAPAKLVLNKDATKRIVTHELKPNSTADAAAARAKKPAAEKKASADKPATEHTATVAGADVAASAVLLATIKKKAAKPVAPAATAEPAAAVPAQDSAAPSKPLTMAEKLANAKKMMKEKQEKMQKLKEAGGDVPVQEAAASTAVLSAVPVVPVLHKGKGAKTDKPKPAVSIVSILTKAKVAKEAGAAKVAEEVAPAPAPAPAAEAVDAPAAVADAASAPAAPTVGTSSGSPKAAAKKKPAAGGLVPAKVIIAKPKAK